MSTENTTRPTLGRIVLYTLTEDDALAVNRRRDDAHDVQMAHVNDETGTARMFQGEQVHVGNRVAPGDVFPMMITRVWGSGMPESAVNGQVFLDGNDVLWVTSRTHGFGPGYYVWPTRS